ncbi:MAG: helix-turn-helix domain-containing protein, partial [Tsuneonella troitsensis]
NVIERAVYRWGDAETPIAHIVFDPFDSPWKPAFTAAPKDAQKGQTQSPPHQAAPDFDSIEDLRAAVDSHERAIVESALGRHRWNQRQTARALGLTYDQLRHCIRKHGLMQIDEGD